MKHINLSTLSKRVALASLLVLSLAACSGDKPETMLASARDYLAKNDLKAAVIQVKNALQANPDLPEARYLLGLALLRGGDPVGSETELRKALALKHPPELVQPLLAQALLMQGQVKKITDEFASTTLAQPGPIANLKTSLASAYAAQGNTASALSALDAALAADPGYAPALIVKARNSAQAGKFDEALATVESVLAQAPKNYEALKLKGDILLVGKNQKDEALAAYRQALDANPGYTVAHAAILSQLLRDANLAEAGKQLELLKKSSPNSGQTRYFETMLAYQSKDLKKAREAALQLLKIAPDSPQALQLAGAIELGLNSLLQAETYLTKVVTSTPNAALARRLLVTTYLRSGQSAKALEALQPALKGDNLDVATNALAGEVYLQNGDAKKAEAYFAKATTQDPKNPRTRTALALTHMATGGGEAAFGELQDIAETDSGTMADLALISVNLRRQDYDKALKAIAGLEKKQPDKPLAANLRGRVLLAKNDVAGARKSFEQSLAIDPTYFASVASLAALDMVDKKPEQARKRFEAVLAKNPKSGQALLALAELSARTGGPNSEVADLIKRAVEANPTEKTARLLLVDFHLRNKEFKEALSAAQSAVAAVPDSPELLDALGRAQQLSGDANQAMTTFGKVAAMQPTSPLPQMRLAEAHLAAKDKNGAIQSLRKALEIKPDFLDAQRALIGLLLDAKGFSDATVIARQVQKQRPKESAGYVLEGDIASAQKKWDVAAQAYSAGLKQVATPDLAIKLHAAYGLQGKKADQAKTAAEWLKGHPKDLAFRMYLGTTAIASKDYQAAADAYASMVQIEPRSAVALNNLAWVSGQLKKDGAIGYAERAVALDPNQPAYMDTLAMLLSDKGDYAKALEWQTKALALQPASVGFKFNLAKIHIKGGKKDLARKELEDLAKLGDKFPAQAEVATLLKSL